MILRFILLSSLALYWNGLGESVHTVGLPKAKAMYIIKLQRFRHCTALKPQHKPLEIFDCLLHLKLERDPYWNIMINNKLHHLDYQETQLTEAIKILQYLWKYVKSGPLDPDLSWNKLKEAFESEGSGSGSGDYSYDFYSYKTYGYDDYGIDDEDRGLGSGSGSGDGDDSYVFPSLTGSRGWQELQDFIDAWKKLIGAELDSSNTISPTTGTPYKECLSPYVEIAYKVCILPVLDKQLSWNAAKHYCRSKGSTLALDPAVVKGRRYLNNLLGVSGTRERWTMWIGAKKSEGDGRWYWDDGLKVPGFLWKKGQPRTYSSYSLPSGACMALDGFAEYYGTALPCNNRRRFVCQKH